MTTDSPATRSPARVTARIERLAPSTRRYQLRSSSIEHSANHKYRHASDIKRFRSTLDLIGLPDDLWNKSDRYHRLRLTLSSGALDRERTSSSRERMGMIVDVDAPGVAPADAPTHLALPRSNFWSFR